MLVAPFCLTTRRAGFAGLVPQRLGEVFRMRDDPNPGARRGAADQARQRRSNDGCRLASGSLSATSDGSDNP